MKELKERIFNILWKDKLDPIKKEYLLVTLGWINACIRFNDKPCEQEINSIIKQITECEEEVK